MSAVALKEVALKAGKDAFDGQVRVLNKIQQSLASVKKDFESEKRELEKALFLNS